MTTAAASKHFELNCLLCEFTKKKNNTDLNVSTQSFQRYKMIKFENIFLKL